MFKQGPMLEQGHRKNPTNKSNQLKEYPGFKTMIIIEYKIQRMYQKINLSKTWHKKLIFC